MVRGGMLVTMNARRRNSTPGPDQRSAVNTCIFGCVTGFCIYTTGRSVSPPRARCHRSAVPTRSHLDDDDDDDDAQLTYHERVATLATLHGEDHTSQE